MLQVMRGEPPGDADSAQRVAFAGLRFEAAKAAAPYVHPKLSAIEHTGKDGKDLQLLPPVLRIVMTTVQAGKR